MFYRTFTSSAILRTLCPVRNLGSLSRAQRGFVETPSKYCPNGQKNGRARRLAREKQVFEVRCAHPRPPQSSCSAAIRIADAASTSRDIAAKVFHLKSPADRPARFGVPLVQRVPPPAVPSQVPTAHAHVDEQKEPRESAHSAWRRKQAATTRASPCAVDGA